MHSKHLISAFGLLVVGTSSAAVGKESYEKRAELQPSVRLQYPHSVTFQGSRNNSVESFLNIKFGSDTSGQNRFAPPRPYTYQPNSIVNASRPGAACPQQKIPIPGLSLFDPVGKISEDCLNLRVDRPAGTPEHARLPVMVYIYGGGDTIGQIYDGAYDPSNLVLTAHQKGYPVIYVAMNYRLGIFGFASSPSLAAADSLNVGLLDQRIALEWIQEHIAAFGGDPDNVTIFGESAGATNIGLQITAYGGQVRKTPFKRAIMQSGGPTANWGTAGNSATNSTAAVIAGVNCTSSSSKKELSCLRALSLSSLLNFTIQYELSVAQWGFGVFSPIAPSSFLPDNPSTLMFAGRFARDIDVISGWNENDFSLFVDPKTDSDADVIHVLPSLNNGSLAQALKLYPVAEYEGYSTGNVSAQYFRASQMARDAQYTCASLFMTQANLNFSCSTTTNYLFALNQTVFATLFQQFGTAYYGVSHFSDVPFVFDQATTRFAKVSSPSDRIISSLMSGSWAAFASSGHTSGRNGTLSDWAQVRKNTVDVRIIGGPNDRLENINGYERLVERCNFWNSPDILRQMQV